MFNKWMFFNQMLDKWSAIIRIRLRSIAKHNGILTAPAPLPSELACGMRQTTMEFKQNQLPYHQN